MFSSEFKTVTVTVILGNKLSIITRLPVIILTRAVCVCHFLEIH